MSLVERATAFLLEQSEPLLMGDVCLGLGITRGMSAHLADKLRLHLGDRLIQDVRRRPGHTRKYVFYSIEGAVGIKPRRAIFTPPADLWRLWVAPK